MFIFAFGLLVLPLFLLVCVQMINQSSFAKRPGGIALKIIFYLSISLSVIGSLLLFAQV